MALKACKECKRMGSDSAENCPFCGVARPGYGGNEFAKDLALMLLAMPVLVVLLVVCGVF